MSGRSVTLCALESACGTAAELARVQLLPQPHGLVHDCIWPRDCSVLCCAAQAMSQQGTDHKGPVLAFTGVRGNCACGNRLAAGAPRSAAAAWAARGTAAGAPAAAWAGCSASGALFSRLFTDCVRPLDADNLVLQRPSGRREQATRSSYVVAAQKQGLKAQMVGAPCMSSWHTPRFCTLAWQCKAARLANSHCIFHLHMPLAGGPGRGGAGGAGHGERDARAPVEPRHGPDHRRGGGRAGRCRAPGAGACSSRCIVSAHPLSACHAQGLACQAPVLATWHVRVKVRVYAKTHTSSLPQPTCRRHALLKVTKQACRRAHGLAAAAGGLSAFSCPLRRCTAGRRAGGGNGRCRRTSSCALRARPRSCLWAACMCACSCATRASRCAAPRRAARSHAHCCAPHGHSLHGSDKELFQIIIHVDQAQRLTGRHSQQVPAGRGGRAQRGADLLGGPAAQAFLEGLLAAYTARATDGGDAGTALVLAAAAAALLQEHPALAEHSAALGYVDALLRLLVANLPPAAGASGWCPGALCTSLPFCTLMAQQSAFGRQIWKACTCKRCAQLLARRPPLVPVCVPARVAVSAQRLWQVLQC